MNTYKLNQIRYMHPALLKNQQTIDMLRNDLIRTWTEISWILANENFFKVLELWGRATGKEKTVKEIKEALMRINFYISNI